MVPTQIIPETGAENIQTEPVVQAPILVPAQPGVSSAESQLNEDFRSPAWLEEIGTGVSTTSGESFIKILTQGLFDRACLRGQTEYLRLFRRCFGLSLSGTIDKKQSFEISAFEVTTFDEILRYVEIPEGLHRLKAKAKEKKGPSIHEAVPEGAEKIENESYNKKSMDNIFKDYILMKASIQARKKIDHSLQSLSEKAAASFLGLGDEPSSQYFKIDLNIDQRIYVVILVIYPSEGYR